MWGLVTLASAFVREDGAFVFADTAVTSTGRQASHPYSFMEEPQQYGRVAVQEALLKILRLGPYLVACAGDVSRLHDVVRMMRGIAHHVKGDELVRRVVATYAPWHSDRHVELLFAWHDGRPRIAHWSSTNANSWAYGDEGLLIGSPDAHIQQNAAVLGQTVMTKRLSPDDCVALYLGSLQCSGRYYGFMEHGVGGVYAGAYVDRRGVHWQRDTMFILYSRADLGAALTKVEDRVHRYPNTNRHVLSAVRGDSLALLSYTPAFAFQLFGSNDQAQWARRWGNSLRRKLWDFAATYYVFLSRDAPIATIVPSSTGRPVTHDFTWKITAPGHAETIITERLRGLLLRDPRIERESGRVADVDVSFCGEESMRPLS